MAPGFDAMLYVLRKCAVLMSVPVDVSVSASLSVTVGVGVRMRLRAGEQHSVEYAMRP